MANEHSDTDGRRDASFKIEDGKVVGFHCFHASHQHKHLEDVRQLFGITKDKTSTKNRRKTIVTIFGQLGVRFEHDVFADKIYYCRRTAAAKSMTPRRIGCSSTSKTTTN